MKPKSMCSSFGYMRTYETTQSSTVLEDDHPVAVLSTLIFRSNIGSQWSCRPYPGTIVQLIGAIGTSTELGKKPTNKPCSAFCHSAVLLWFLGLSVFFLCYLGIGFLGPGCPLFLGLAAHCRWSL